MKNEIWRAEEIEELSGRTGDSSDPSTQRASRGLGEDERKRQRARGGQKRGKVMRRCGLSSRVLERRAMRENLSRRYTLLYSFLRQVYELHAARTSACYNLTVCAAFREFLSRMEMKIS